MVPAGQPTEQTVEALAARMQPGDIIIDGGNSYYKDDVRRATALKAKGIHYVDVGTSGGVWGLERGYCLMVGRVAGGHASARSRSSRRWLPDRAACALVARPREDRRAPPRTAISTAARRAPATS